MNFAPVHVPLPLRVEPWVLMWILAALLWATLKTLTLAQSLQLLSTSDLPNHHRFPPKITKHAAAYLLLWIGLDPSPFLNPTTTIHARTPRPLTQCAHPITCLLLGITTAYIATLPLPFFVHHPIAHGWIAMLSIALTLHFGLFTLLAFALQGFGYPVQPIMDHPTHSQSLSELWGRRWNRGFSDAARALVVRRLGRRCGPKLTGLLVYLISGLLHECVISIPAGAGYGLPTLYFLIQGLGALAQATRTAHRHGLHTGIPGRCITAAVALLPLPLLFHAPFIHQVILPMFDSLKP